MIKIVTAIVTIIVTIIVLVIWAVVGFLLWIPFLTRMIVIFVAAIIIATTRGKDPTPARQGLEAGITFYVQGFTLILSTMNNSVDMKQFISGDVEIRQLLGELIFAIIFWVAIGSAWLIGAH